MLSHKGTQILNTERLKLRKFTIDDAQSMFDNWASDERVTRFLTWEPHESPEVTKQLLELWCREYEKDDNYHWAIEYNGTLIGSINVVRMSDGDEWAELGYCIGYNYWRKGIMPEAAKAVIDFLFSEVGVNRISISYAAKNLASGRVAKKCGLTYEGTKREYFKTSEGEFLNIATCSILRSEWVVKE